MRRDYSFFEQRPDGVIHELHSLSFSGNDHILEFLCRAFANDCGDGGVGDQNFIDGDAPWPVRSLQEQLRDDAAKRVRKHRACLRLPVGRKSVHHAIHCLAGIVSVQRADYEETCLGRSKCERNRFEVAHLTYQHDIGVLPQRGLESGGKRNRIARYFPLRNDAALIVVHEFDRFLDRDDVLGEILINEIDERRLCCGFTGARWTGDENKPAA